MKRLLLAGLAAACMTVAFGTQLSAQSPSYKATCSVNAGVTGGQKYATLKCRQKDKPGAEDVRMVVWERKDKEGYRELARLSGRRYTCTMVPDGTGYDTQARYRYVKPTDCK